MAHTLHEFRLKERKSFGSFLSIIFSIESTYRAYRNLENSKRIR